MSDPLKWARRILVDELGYEILKAKADGHLKLTVRKKDGMQFLLICTRSPSEFEKFRRMVLKNCNQSERRKQGRKTVTA